MNGHECKVFSASNVELITKTRLEHLSEADKIRARSPRTPLHSFLGIAEQTQQEGAAGISVIIFLLYFCKNIFNSLLLYLVAYATAAREQF